MQRRCGNCHGPVTHRFETIELQAPTAFNSHATKMVRGLGHWHCSNGCPKRAAQVTRYVGAGKESEFRADGQAKIVRDEYLHSINVLRDIHVETARPTSKAKGASA